MHSASRTNALAVGSLALFWAVLLTVSGAVTAGYHLVDDHEIVHIAADLRHAPLWTVASRWITGDLAWRFRPLYIVHRVAEAAAFGDHFLAWSIYTAALGVACAVLLHAALRTMAFSPAESWTFAFFALVGQQSAVWWRLGPNETIGMVLFAAAALALAQHARTGSPAARVSFVAAVVLASLCKESFILAIPAILFGEVWAWRTARGASWAGATRHALPEGAVLLAVMMAELLFIKLRVGTEGIGYAGIAGLTVSKALVTARAIALFGDLWWVILPVAAITAVLGGIRPMLRAAAPTAVLFAATVGPQAILYAKSGVVERYYLPGVLGPAFAVAACLRYLRTRPGRASGAALIPGIDGRTGDRLMARLRHAVTARRAAMVAAAVALAELANVQMQTAYRNARSFATEGDQAFVERLAASGGGGPILIAGGLSGVYECFWSLQWYLDCKARRRDVYFEFVDHEPRSDFANKVVKGFEADTFFRKRDPARAPVSYAAVGILAGDEAAFLSSAGWFDSAAYTRQEVGTKRLVVYAKR